MNTRLKQIFISIVALFMQVLIYSTAPAEVAGPGWILGSAEPVSIDESKAYYQTVVPNKGVGTLAASGGTIVPFSATTVTPEIAELARALRYDPKLIYDYVYNNIDYVPYFGSLKGATLTLFDGCGNDFDMSSLMIALLRESGYTANYYYGTTFYNDITFAEWAGVSDWIFTNRTAVTDLAVKILGNGGIPLSRMGSSSMLIRRACVKVTISGTDYFLDPIAWRTYTYKSKIDIGSATGYNRSDFLNAATTGATVDSDSVQNLNQANLNNKLTEYTTNLVNTLRSQYPNSDVKDIIGGRKIDQSQITSFPTSVPYLDTYTWTDIPTVLIATLRIQHEGIDYTSQIPDIAGKRLTVTYTGSNFTPELRLDGALISTGNSTTQGSKYDLIISVDHPYAANNGTYQDQTATYKCVSGSTYAIISDFDGTTDDLIRKRQRELSQNLANGLVETSEPVLGEALNVMGSTWMKETRLTDRILDGVGNTIFLRHHAIGLMAQEGGYYIDIRMAAYTGSKRQIGSYSGMKSFLTRLTVGSAFEHAILEQLMGSDNPGASTIKLMQIANSQGSKVFWANSANFATIQPQLQDYSAQTLSDIQNDINAGKTVILPANGQLGINHWQGTGYASKFIAADQTSASLGMIISGGYFGGFSSNEALIDPQSVWVDVATVQPDISYNLEIPSIHSKEPVDMATGAYTYDRTDITLGASAPMGLRFSRSYNSSRNGDKRSMGYGWQHNYDIFLSRVSDGDPGLGLRTPVDAAAMITNLYIADDLMSNEDSITGWMVMFLGHKWAIDRLIDNAISVNIGGQVTEYIKLPDGSYNNPPGITTQLIDNGNGTFSLKERFGAQMDFDATDRITQLKDVDGNTLSFVYIGNKLSSVQDVAGRTLTLNYTGDNLTSVVDSSGRSVGFTYLSDNLVSYTDVTGKPWGYGYDGQHQMTSLTNPLAITTATNTYDTLGRVNTQSVPRQGQGITATYNFYFSGFRNAEEDPYGRQTIYYLDEKGRTYKLEDALSNKTTKTFDGQNHEVAIKDALNHTTAFTYDGNQNLTQTTDALSKNSINTYDAQFHLTDIADPLNHTTHFDYDPKHHLTATTVKPTDTATIITGLTYYPNGQTETTTDGRGTVTTLTYDNKNQPLTTKTALHPAITYNYDAIGRMLSLTDQEGVTTNFFYDNRGLVLTRTDPLGKAAGFIYDDAGRLASRTDRNNHTITYTYTPTDNIDTVTYPDNSTITFAYNLHDKVTSMQDSIGTTAYTYDEVYRLKSVTNPYGQVVSYEYDAAGNITKIIYPGNKNVTYAYDQLNRIKTVTNWLSQTTTYNYDDAGRLTSVTNFNGTVTSYGYDNANRMISLQNKTSDTGTIISSYSYTLDNNGNRTRIVQQEPIIPVNPLANTDLTYNPTKNRLLSAGQTNFTYDDEGQLATKDTASYSFDYEHRLKSISGTDTIQYKYDGKGNRLEANRNGVVTRYLYDASGNLLAETDSNNTITRYYIYGLGLLAMVDSTGQTYTYHYNGIGSTILMTDQNKNIVNRYFYAPFGLITNQQETIPQPFKYVGQHGIMQESNGLYYMKARYYDPEVQRFISEDPAGFEGGDVNLYAYVGNNPMNWVDPFGLLGEGSGKTGWWPKELNLVVPGYRNYGGPSRNGPGEPEDLMDAAFQRHDIGYSRGELEQSDLRLLYDLSNLPVNPLEWGEGVNPVYAETYRIGAAVIFSTRIVVIEIAKGATETLPNK